MKPIPGFEGPRPILRRERRSGEALFKICFGGGDPENTGESDDPVDPDGSDGDRGWIVMLSSEGSYQGKVVSQIGVFPSKLLIGDSKVKIGSIGGVSTHPDFRNKGLAGQILEYCAQQLSEAGVHLMLISGDRGLYTRTGNVKALRFNEFHLVAGSLKQPECLPEVTLRQFAKGEAPILSRLYQEEAVHFHRRLRNFEESFTPGDLWIVEQSGVPVAYFLRMPWYSEPGKFEVVEFAGSRLALAAGFFQILSGVNDPPHGIDFSELRIQVPWQDVDLSALLVQMGVESIPKSLWGHTMRLVNFPAMRQDLSSYITARLSPALRRGLRFEQSGPLLLDPILGDSGEDRCALVWRRKRFELSTAQMTRLVFGAWDMIEEPYSEMPDIPAPLDEVIHHLFPLPAFQPGLNLR